MKKLLTISLIISSLGLSAQETPPPPKVKPAPKVQAQSAKATDAQLKKATSGRRVVLPPKASTGRRATRPTVRAARTRPAAAVDTQKPQFVAENVTIQLKGMCSNDLKLDLAMTGVGPTFQSELMIGDDSTIISQAYTLLKNGEGYKVEYSLGLRVRVEAVGNGPRVNQVEYRDITMSGTVLAKEGTPVKICSNNGREVSLTISKAE